MKKEELQKAISGTRILIVGDVMLDRYWFGRAERISPEAPVPVVLVDKTEHRLGGAANVALNARRQGANVDLVSVRGDDSEGVELEQLLVEEGITPSVYVDSKLSTTMKTRVVAQHQQLVRIDFENTPSEHALDLTLSKFDQLLTKIDLVVISDYGKGSLRRVSRMIERAKELGKLVLVDPKGDDYARYTGADYITPNRSELRRVVGGWDNEQALIKKVNNLRSACNIGNVLLTRSEEGMTLFSSDGAENFSTTAKEIYDVSGAGDTVIAILAVMLAVGLSVDKSVRLANKAAGLVIAKLGTASVDFHELFAEG